MKYDLRTVRDLPVSLRHCSLMERLLRVPVGRELEARETVAAWSQML